MITLLLLSHFYWHRSLMATFVAIFLRLKHKPVMKSRRRAFAYFAKQGNKNKIRKPRFHTIGLKAFEEKSNFEDDPLLIFNKDSERVIIYLHGGAYAKNITKHHLKMIDKIAKGTNIRIYVPIYKKAPLYCYEDVIPEMIKFYRTIAKDHRVILMGDSSGGGMAIALAIKLKEFNIRQPERIITLSPWVDVSLAKADPSKIKYDSMEGINGAKVFGEYWAKGDTKNPLVSPAYGDLSNLPPIDIFTGGKEVLLNDIYDFVEKLKKVNGEYTLDIQPYMGHVYQAYPIREAKEGIRKIIDVVNMK